MQILPQFTHQGFACRLPMADRSASALVHAWSEGNPFSLAQAMAQDPSFAVWGAQAHQAAVGPIPPTNGLLFLAGWLCRRGKGTLSDKTVGEAELESPLHERVLEAAELNARGRLVAELAARLAEEQPADAPSKDRVRLLALLSQRNEWLRWAGVPEGDLAPTNGETPEFVARACAIAGGQAAVPESWGLSSAALEAKRAEYACQWLTPAELFSWEALSHKLEDADLLYDRFDQHLERAKLEAMAEFAAGAGHEINNPLAIISGRAQLLLRDEKDPERRRELAAIHAQATRVYEMIADMMLFARPPAAKKEPIDAAKLVEGLVRELAPLAAERKTELVFAVPAEPVPVQADRTQLQVAIRAIVENAFEAMGSNGRVELAVRPVNGFVEVTVSDTGPGITPQVREHLFDPYFSGRQAGRGLGLGLSKAWRIIVTNHGGTIDVESQPGSGAKFAMKLPRG